MLGRATHCFVVSLSHCRVCSAPALAAVPIQSAKPSRAPVQPRRASGGRPPGSPAWEGFCPSACRALLAEADSAAPGEHSKSLNMFAPSLFLQTALAGRTVPRFIPQAKRKQLQEAAKCVQQLQLSLRLQGRTSSAAPLLHTHAARPACGCSLGGFDCTDTIPLQIRCCIWSLALLPVIKGVKLCHGLNSAVAANFFPSTLNCPDLGVS